MQWILVLENKIHAKSRSIHFEYRVNSSGFKNLLNCLYDQQTKHLDKPNVYIRDAVGVRDKLRKLYEGGPEKLQVCHSKNNIG